MTIEELKRHCEKTINIFQGSRACEEHALVLTLIEKQIPKKLIKEDRSTPLGIDGYHCPTCGDRRARGLCKYCCNCGQALNWREGEENG